MKSLPRRDEPSPRPAVASDRGAPDRGAPANYAVHAERKNVAVRVVVAPSGSESEELREPGYGHGV